MSSVEEKLVKKIGQLLNTTEFDECLAQVKQLIISAKPNELLNAMNQIDFGILVRQFYEKKEHVDLNEVISVFGLILENLPANYIITKFYNELLDGLASSHEHIIEMWLKPVERCLSDESVLLIFSNKNVPLSPILIIVITLLGHESVSIANYSHKILLKIAKNLHTQSDFFDKELQEKFYVIKVKNDVVRMRVYQLMIEIAISSPLHFERIDNLGYINELISYFKKQPQHDPLGALNCSQIIIDLASSGIGVQFIQDSGLLNSVTKKINNYENDPFGRLTIPGFIKIFGAVLHTKPQLINDYSSLIQNLIHLSEMDRDLLLIVIDTIGIIGSGTEGKKLLDKQPNFNEFIKSIGLVLQNDCNTETKVRCLNCLVNLFQISEPDPNGQATAVIQSWHSQLIQGKRPVLTIIEFCREPFKELRLVGLEVIRVMASQVWGQKELSSLPGFLEYIIDRSTEFEKFGKEAKYNIIRELVMSPFIAHSFTREAIFQLKKYYKDGPFHVNTETAVAFESAN